MPQFSSKEEVDAWYVAAMEGLGRLAALDYNNSTERTIQAHYAVPAHGLDILKKRAYELLGIQEEPKLLKWNFFFQKHMVE